MFTLVVSSRTKSLDMQVYQFTTLKETIENIKTLLKEDNDLCFELWYDDI